MDAYRLGSLFLDISLGVGVVGALIRVIALVYFQRKPGDVITDTQRHKIRHITLPIAISALVFGIISVVLLFS